MRPIIEWCGVCLQDDVKVLGDSVIEQVPLCKGCVIAYGKEKEVLRDARQFLRDIDKLPEEKPAAPMPEGDAELCKCGKELGHAGRCKGHAHYPPEQPPTAPIRIGPPPVKHIPIPLGKYQVRFMKTDEYIAQYGAIRSKGMKTETQELWEKLSVMSIGECIVIEVPGNREPLKFRSSLSNTIQRLARVNKVTYRLRLGANLLKRHVVIAKESMNGHNE